MDLRAEQTADSVSADERVSHLRRPFLPPRPPLADPYCNTTVALDDNRSGVNAVAVSPSPVTLIILLEHSHRTGSTECAPDFRSVDERESGRALAIIDRCPCGLYTGRDAP